LSGTLNVYPSSSSTPFAGLIFDSSGNLYGTTYGGSANCCGEVFQLTPTAGGSWKEKILHRFQNDATDGGWPLAGLIFATAGNLYGTTSIGGSHAWGTAFELRAEKDGGWKERILHNFNDNSRDGAGRLA
jgi:uncharacterized repeat protein (TIGR03803 family)